MSNDMDLYKRWVELENEKIGLEAQLDGVKAEMAGLEPRILEAMVDSGVARISVDGRTLFTNRSLYAAPAEGKARPDVVAALKTADLGDFVSENYNANSLSAYVREVADAAGGRGVVSLESIHDNLPEALRGVLTIVEKFSVRSRKA